MFIHIWHLKDKLVLYTLCLIWAISVSIFWAWWFQPRHIGSLWSYSLTTLVIAWAVMLPAYCFFFVTKMRRISRKGQLHPNTRIGVVVTKAPSEPLFVVQETLEGVLAMTGAHDTWVADEDPTEEAIAWYTSKGIKLSCRRDDPNYHNLTWPRRRKCKEGNLAYFYDKYGYEMYDIVIQMDADHVPARDYLQQITRPFADSRVGYVGAPSICTSNEDQSWSARARSHAEAVFHGPIQSGSNAGWVPICIGSHYAIRTKALKSIGGIGPDLAEDYSTTLLMNAHGWQGVWSYDAVAYGAGPNTFSDLVVQDYQWSRSLVTLFTTFFPKFWSRLSPKQKLQFVITQLWYPMGAIVWFISIALPIVSLLTGIAPAKVDFREFVVFSTVPFLVGIFFFLYIRSGGYLRPHNVKLFSWENALFELARWPWVFIATTDAIISAITRKQHTFRVTPKGGISNYTVPTNTLVPYIAVILANLFAMNFRQDDGHLQGYFIFAAISAFAYLVLVSSAVILHINELAASVPNFQSYKHYPQLGAVLALSIWACFIVLPPVSSPFVSAYDPDREFISPVPDTKFAMPAIEEKPVSTSTSVAELEPITSTTHTVQEGESLWRIARRYYGKGSYWSLITTSDGSRVIHPGDEVHIPTPGDK